MSAIAPLTGYKVGTADLNTIFAKYVSGVQATATGYKDGTADLNTIFAKYVSGQWATATGYKVGSNDLNNFYQKYSDLVTNGDFAGTGSGTSIVANGWTFINSSSNTSVGSAITDPEYPTYISDSAATSFVTGIVGAYVTVNQTVTTVSGRAYTFSFWLLMGGPSTSGGTLSCTASIGGSQKLSTTTSNASYVFYSYPYTANSTSTVISFVCRQDPSYLHITHVRLTYP